MDNFVVERGVIQKDHWIDHLRTLSRRFVVVTDDHVKTLFGDHLQAKLTEKGLEVFLLSVKPGEMSKTRRQKEILEDQMVEMGLGRDTAIIALGGGVVTDLAGFLAATYCRGISFISIPTTLLGMVDASIGGKVGVNASSAKNLIGTFYHPHVIYIDMDLLETLPSQEHLNGMAEMIKYGLIASPKILNAFHENTFNDDLIHESCRIKNEIVKSDPYEKGLRRVLNYGHTVGHAIETASHYQISHGEAIAMGMIAEGYLSMRLGFLKKCDFLQMKTLFQKTGFSLKFSKNLDQRKIYEIMSLDKKAILSQPRFVLLETLGNVMPFEGNYCSVVDPTLIQEMLSWMCIEFAGDNI